MIVETNKEAFKKYQKNYILAFESAREIKEHFANLLPMDSPEAQAFYKEFTKRWKPISSSGTVMQKKHDYLDDFMKPKKDKRKEKKQDPTMIEDTQLPQTYESNNKENNILMKDAENLDPSVMSVDVTGAEFLDKNKPMIGEIRMKSCSPFKKKNLKFIPLFGADGKMKTDTVTLPGRHPCQCLAQKHKLINNCDSCGRIVCEQEGAGPCMFCGNLVCTPEDQEIINRESKQGRKLKDKLLLQHVPDDAVEKEKDAGLQRALDHKNRLLQYDRNFTKRTKVIDDESDYFASDNRWLSNKQRNLLTKKEQDLRDKRFASRLDKKFTIDFAGRKIVESEENNHMYIEEDISTPIDSLKRNEQLTNIESDDRNPLIDPRIGVQPPTFHPAERDETSEETRPKNVWKGSSTNNHKKRLQDNQLQEISDQGMCMSMHQPWASLLVHGIKKLEGRSWYTPHRGRLWIASTAQRTDQEDIKHVVDDYKRMYSDIPSHRYPKDYPSSALLGCVNVVDCASNEEYFQKHPMCTEENGSAYLFVCENPEQLKIKFQISGKHKIYKLEPHIYVAAKKNLQFLS